MPFLPHPIQGTCYHTKNQENNNLNEKRQSIDANTEMTQILELTDKDFKATITKVVQ